MIWRRRKTGKDEFRVLPVAESEPSVVVEPSADASVSRTCSRFLLRHPHPLKNKNNYGSKQSMRFWCAVLVVLFFVYDRLLTLRQRNRAHQLLVQQSKRPFGSCIGAPSKEFSQAFQQLQVDLNSTFVPRTFLFAGDCYSYVDIGQTTADTTTTTSQDADSVLYVGVQSNAFNATRRNWSRAYWGTANRDIILTTRTRTITSVHSSTTQVKTRYTVGRLPQKPFEESLLQEARLYRDLILLDVPDGNYHQDLSRKHFGMLAWAEAGGARLLKQDDDSYVDVSAFLQTLSHYHYENELHYAGGWVRYDVKQHPGASMYTRHSSNHPSYRPPFLTGHGYTISLLGLKCLLREAAHNPEYHHWGVDDILLGQVWHNSECSHIHPETLVGGHCPQSRGIIRYLEIMSRRVWNRQVSPWSYPVFIFNGFRSAKEWEHGSHPNTREWC